MLSRGGPLDPSHEANVREPDDAIRAGGLFCCPTASNEEATPMPNHLTPEELAKEMRMDRDEVIRICLAEGVPIYNGKVDKTLFAASLEAVGTASSSAAQN
jgi:hypothetical protein